MKKCCKEMYKKAIEDVISTIFIYKNITLVELVRILHLSLKKLKEQIEDDDELSPSVKTEENKNNNDKNNKSCEEKCKYVIARSCNAGVFAGEIESKTGQEVLLKNARRLWFWDGAASLSQLAMEGVKKPENCKFPCEVNRVLLLDVVEILDVTDKAKKSIKGVPIWEV
jgi:hypothetical protein